MAILQGALAPALIAANEFNQGRWVLLPAEIFLRQYTDVIARTAHECGFDLVVAQHMATEHATLRQLRDMAMFCERRDANDGVVAPIRSAVGLPPGAAYRPRPHAKPHPELEDSRKRAG